VCTIEALHLLLTALAGVCFRSRKHELGVGVDHVGRGALLAAVCRDKGH
jgi:hypothetical protein